MEQKSSRRRRNRAGGRKNFVFPPTPVNWCADGVPCHRGHARSPLVWYFAVDVHGPARCSSWSFFSGHVVARARVGRTRFAGGGGELAGEVLPPPAAGPDDDHVVMILNCFPFCDSFRNCKRKIQTLCRFVMVDTWAQNTRWARRRKVPIRAARAKTWRWVERGK